MEAGLTLVAEAQEYAKNDLDRARGLRNGLMLVSVGFGYDWWILD